MSVAVLVPCYNEELTIRKVVGDFRRELPEADIYVYDNNSSDNTVEEAKAAGAIVRHEPRQGKGFVVRQMFFDIDADFYIMVDGDDTYPAEAVQQLLSPLKNGSADMTIGDRLSNGTYAEENKRAFHGLGNSLVRRSINQLYHSNIRDVMTGYRGFNRLFVQSLPVMSDGFQIETEFTIHAVDKRFRLVEVPIEYRDRPEGSFSKLNTFSDGARVLLTIARMLQESHPMSFFGMLGFLLFIAGLVTGIPVIIEFAKNGFIDKLPSAVLATGFVTLGILLVITGIILSAINKVARQQYELNLHAIVDYNRRSRQDGK